jgi:hypothetical protein
MQSIKITLTSSSTSTHATEARSGRRIDSIQTKTTCDLKAPLLLDTQIVGRHLNRHKKHNVIFIKI